MPWGTAGVAVDVVSPSGIGELDPNRHRVVFLANVGDPALVGPPLVDFVRKGRTSPGHGPEYQCRPL